MDVSNCNAQNWERIDSLKNSLVFANSDSAKATIYCQLAFQLYNTDPNMALMYGEKGLAISRSLGHRTLEARCLNNIGVVQNQLANYAEAIASHHESLRLSTSNSDSLGVASSFTNLAIVYDIIGDNLKAAENYLGSAKIYELLGNNARLADLWNNLCLFYGDNGEYEQAIKYGNKALEAYQSLGSKSGISSALVNMGNIKRNLKAFNEAHGYYNRALSTCIEANIPFGVMISRLNIGVTYMMEKKEDEALKQFLEALPIAREVDPVYGTSSILNNIAEVYFTKKDYNTAQQYASECLALAKSAQILEELLDVYQILADIHEAKGNHKLSIEYLKQFNAVRDGVEGKERQDKIAELSARYESEKREKELQLNAQEIELLNRDNKIKTLTNSLLVISLTIVILAALIYFLYQRNQKRKLTEDVHFKNQMLSMHALQMIQKNGILESIKQNVAEIADKSGDDGKVLSKIRSHVDAGLSQDKNWEEFANIFSQVHVGFFNKLRKENADITTGEIRLAALLRLNLATKEIASILGISPSSANIARYRLRKKLNLTREEDLVDFLTKFG